VRPQSCKAKGRRLQQEVRDVLRQIGTPYGLVDGDIESRGMGQAGVDIILSPAAQRVFDLAVECKNVENLNVAKVFKEHYAKYEALSALKLLIHTKNHHETLVTMKLNDFISLFQKGLTK
jgi:hypothetical protein